MHSTDTKLIQKSQNIISFSGKKSQSKIIRKVKNPYSNSFESSGSYSQDRKNLFPDIHFSKHQSRSTLRNHKAPVNKSFAGSPVNLESLLIENRSDKRMFSPYTLKDYKKIKPNKYILLGGLGANIGNEDWKKASEKKQKMKNYWKTLKKNNFIN